MSSLYSRHPQSLKAECSSHITRTTNACESFHSKLNKMFHNSNPNIYIRVFLKAINDVQTNNYLKMNCSHVYTNKTRQTNTIF